MKVLLCDSHVLFTEALQRLLVERGYDALTAASPNQAAELLTAGDIDVLVMDVVYQRSETEYVSCADAVRTVVAADPQVRVVVVTATSDMEALREAVAEGAVAVAHKTQPLADLFGIIERVYAGEAVLSGQLMRAAMIRAQSGNHSAVGFLTAREREVLGRLTRGESTRTIAHEMGIAYSTARTHIQSVLDKLGVHSRLEAAAFAARHMF